MTPEEQAKTFFTVESADAFIHSDHNARFRVSEALCFLTDDSASRTSQSSEGRESSIPAPEVRIRTSLRFTVDNVGDQASVVFGSDRATCDVYVDAGSKSDTRLFAVELPSDGRAAVLKNLATDGTCIKTAFYDLITIHRQRAIFPGDDVVIMLAEFDIYVRVCDDSSALHQFYVQQRAPAVPAINQLNLKSLPKSSARPKGHNRYFLYDPPIGTGAHGSVHRATNCHDGTAVAVKKFRQNKSMPLKEAAILQGLSHVCMPPFCTPGYLSLGTESC